MSSLPIEIIRWDTQERTTLFKDENWDPVDLTGATVWFTVKKGQYLNIDNDDNVLIQKVITSHTSPLTWETLIELSNSETNKETWDYYYDLQIKFPNDNIFSVAKWVFSIVQDVTKAT